MLIEHFYTISNKSKEIIEHIRNFICLFVSFSTLYASYSGNIINIKYVSYLIFIHCFTDLLVCNNIIILHHIYTMIGVSYILYYLTEYTDVIIILLTCEISTIFLTIKIYLDYYLSKYNIISIINQLIFIFTFVYCRIYLYTKYVILISLIKIPFYNNVIFFMFLYLFYFLNIYWFLLILRKIVKLSLNYFQQIPYKK